MKRTVISESFCQFDLESSYPQYVNHKCGSKSIAFIDHRTSYKTWRISKVKSQCSQPRRLFGCIFQNIPFRATPILFYTIVSYWGIIYDLPPSLCTFSYFRLTAVTSLVLWSEISFYGDPTRILQALKSGIYAKKD